MKRVLILIHLASAESRNKLTTMAPKITATAQDLLGDCTTAFTSQVALGFAGTTELAIAKVFERFVQRCGLMSQDNVSVVEIGADITSSHPGLSTYQTKTWFVAHLAEFAKRQSGSSEADH